MDKKDEKNMSNLFDIAKVKKIFQELEDVLKEDVALVSQLIGEDNKTFSERASYSKLLEIIGQVSNEKWCMEKNSKTTIIYGVGNLGVVCNGNAQILLYLCLKALKTHNNITFFETFDVRKTSNYIINKLQQIVKSNGYSAKINLIELNKLKDISNYESKINKFICVGDFENYKLLKLNVNKEIIYNSYGTISLYMDDKSLESILLEMDDYVFENNLKLNLYTNEDVEDVINYINLSGEDYCSVIFSKDIEKVKKFISKVDSNMIYINKNPFQNYKFEIEDVKLVKIKKIYI